MYLWCHIDIFLAAKVITFSKQRAKISRNRTKKLIICTFLQIEGRNDAKMLPKLSSLLFYAREVNEVIEVHQILKVKDVPSIFNLMNSTIWSNDYL